MDGIEVKLVGNQCMNVSEDNVCFEVNVGTNMGRICSSQRVRVSRKPCSSKPFPNSNASFGYWIMMENPWLWGPMA